MFNGSLSGPSGVVAILYVVLSAIAVIVIDLRLVLIPTACAILGLIIGGFVIFRPFRTGVVLPWPAQSNPEEAQAAIVINGHPCPFQGYEQDLLVAVRIRRHAELLGCFLLSATALYFMLTRNTSEAGLQIGGFEAEIICICGLMALLTSLRWFTERRFLRLSRIAFGSILGVDPGFFRQGLTYQFFDRQGDRRGGRGPLSSPKDNAVLVLYQPNDADVNTVHGAFTFHSFKMELLPGRRKVSIGAGVQN